MAPKIQRRSLPENYHPLADTPEFLSRIYVSRGVSDPAQLQLHLKKLHDIQTMKGLEKAVSLLSEAAAEGKKVVIVGDFDADGATSTALALEALNAMGIACDYVIPDRFRFGYGLTPEIVELAQTLQPDLIMTVDNGISSFEGVERARDLGIQVLITDHHLPADELPNADAIVNPNQPDCEFPSKMLAGVGVVFYLMSALRKRLRENNWFVENSIPEPNMAEYLDLVALGTVADLVPLDFNNRILVEQGIRRMRALKLRPGIRALFEIAGRDPRSTIASDLGYMVAPRLNAAGRLDEMSQGVECLRAKDMLEAKQRARVLHDLNAERKNIEEQMRFDAESTLASLDLERSSAVGICMFEPHWHQGVIGILASRIKEKLHRPVIAFAPEQEDSCSDNDFLKGSARSIPGLHMRDALDLIAKKHPSILKKFGGHAMAAGMSILVKDYPKFAEVFDETVRSLLNDDQLEMAYITDGELEPEQLTIENITLLERAGPWGQQFPEPSFDGVFKIVQKRVLKNKHLKLVLQSIQGGAFVDAIQFSSPFTSGLDHDHVRVVYRPSVNEFRGNRSVQLLVDYLEPQVV
jgi:single-stranded-DNA-specific exonuclease